MLMVGIVVMAVLPMVGQSRGCENRQQSTGNQT
jgi:hypothetical protein